MPSSKKYLRNIAQVLLLVLFLLGAEILAGEFVNAASWSRKYNQDIQEIVDSGAPVDMIFIGASRTYRTYVPEVFEENLEIENVINGGSSAQGVNGSYYMLRDLLQKFQPRYVVIGVTWDGLLDDYLQGHMVVSDRISPLQRVPFALEVFPENFRYASYICRFADAPQYYMEAGLKKLKYGEQADLESDQEFYIEKGYVAGTISAPQGSFPAETGLRYEVGAIRKDLHAHMEKIAELCDSKDIPYYFVTGPTSMETIYSIDGYQEASDYWSNYAQSHGTKYFNLNYLVGREEFLPDTMMHDSNHVNGEGAYRVSEIFAEILKKEWAGEDTSHYFYKDLDELKKDVKRIVAADVEITKEDKFAVIKTDCLANEDVIPEYRVLISVENGEYQEIFPYSQETKYRVDVSEYADYAFRVEIRQQGNVDYDAFATDLK